jgi:ActR/RegA family two-component response regulator
MAEVLLVDDDPITIDTLGALLRLASHDVTTALTGREAIRIAKEVEPDVAFVDLKLPDVSGIDVIQTLRSESPSTACVVVTGYPTFEYAIEAIRVGACDWLQKPVLGDDILRAVKCALVGKRGRETRELYLQHPEPHALARLAAASVLFIESAHDRPTLHLVGREVGHAAGCLRNWCRTAGMKARAFRDFTRALRAVYRLAHHPEVKISNILEIVDDRTLKSFQVRSGGTAKTLPMSVEEFLRKQQFVQDSQFIDAVSAALDRSRTANSVAKAADAPYRKTTPAR